MLNIHELQVFLVAAETQNFSEAGRRLSISQPAVSMQIRSLETALNTTLFDRSGRHIVLSEAGHALVPMAKELVSRAIQIEETMASLQGEVTGLLKIGCSTTIGKYILPRLTARMLTLHPQVQLACHVVSRGLALQMLREGEAHLAITSLREPHKDIEFRPFLTDHIVLIVPPDHPWAERGVIDPADLLEEPIILREENSGTYESLKDALAWHELSPDHLKTVMVLGNSEAIRIAVQEGIGVSFVSNLVAREGIKAGTVVPVEVRGIKTKQTLYVVRHTGRPATAAQTAFWDFAFAPVNKDLLELPKQGMAHSQTT